MPTKNISNTGNNLAQKDEIFTDYTESPMIISGGEITSGTNAGTFKVAALTGLLREADNETGKLVYITKTAEDNIIISTADITYFVCLNYNDGNPTISLGNSNPYLSDKRSIPIGKVMKDKSNNVHYVSGGYNFQDGIEKLHMRAMTLRKFELNGGSGIAYSGTNNFTMESGIIYGGLNRILVPAYNSTTIMFTPIYQDGIGGWTEGAARTTIDYLFYDDGGGILKPISNNKYGCYWVYRHIGDNDVYVLYGRDSYSLSEAEISKEPTHPIHLKDFGCLIGRIITPQAGGSFTSVVMDTDRFFGGADVANHANLTNLDYASSEHTGFAPALGEDDNYVTDAEKTVIGNTSGTNSGDQNISDYSDGYVLLSDGTIKGINTATEVSEGIGRIAKIKGRLIVEKLSDTSFGDISAAGNIIGNNLSGTNTGDQNVSNYGDNRIITSNGTIKGLNAEQYFTYNNTTSTLFVSETGGAGGNIEATRNIKGGSFTLGLATAFTGVSTGEANNNVLATKGYVDDNETFVVNPTNNYVILSDGTSTGLKTSGAFGVSAVLNGSLSINKFSSETGGDISAAGNITGGSFTLGTAAAFTGVSTGTANNNMLVTKGYVDDNTISIASYGYNRIITSDGTSTGLNAEQYFTYSDYKIGIRGVQTIYIPNQTNFTGTMIFGNGGGTLSHTSSEDGFYNTLIGYGAGYSNTTGYRNSFEGHNAGYHNTTGYYNLFNGDGAGEINETGYNNVFLGKNAGSLNITGYNNIYIGRNVSGKNNNDINETAIGAYAIGNGSNTVTLGDDNVTEVYMNEDGTAKVYAGQFIISSLNEAPHTPTSSGELGDIRICSDAIYVCIGKDSWRRTVLSTWTPS